MTNCLRVYLYITTDDAPFPAPCICKNLFFQGGTSGVKARLPDNRTVGEKMQHHAAAIEWMHRIRQEEGPDASGTPSGTTRYHEVPQRGECLRMDNAVQHASIAYPASAGKTDAKKIEPIAACSPVTTSLSH